MQEFLLELGGRFVRVLIDDSAASGSVPTLVCLDARHAQVLPTEVPTRPEPEPNHWFPRFPSSLREDISRTAGAPAELHVELHQLPPGTVRFALGAFTEKVTDALESGATVVRIDTENGDEWGRLWDAHD